MKEFFSIIFLLFVITNTLQSQDRRPDSKFLVEKPWSGTSEQKANFTRSGKIQLVQTLNLTLHPNNSVSGSAGTTMTLDGKSYYNSTRITGNFTRSEWTLYIEEGKLIKADILPNGLKWCKGHGKLKFYINDSKPGYYLLKGTLKDNCGGSSYIEYSDSPK